MERTLGTVKWFNDEKGWGFIHLPDGREAFVHYSQIAGDGWRTLLENDVVECDLAVGAKGLNALNVVLVVRAPGAVIRIEALGAACSLDQRESCDGH